MTIALILLGAAILAAVMYGVGRHDGRQESDRPPADEDEDEPETEGQRRTARLLWIHNEIMYSGRYDVGDPASWEMARKLLADEIVVDETLATREVH